MYILEASYFCSQNTGGGTQADYNKLLISKQDNLTTVTRTSQAPCEAPVCILV